MLMLFYFICSAVWAEVDCSAGATHQELHGSVVQQEEVSLSTGGGTLAKDMACCGECAARSWCEYWVRETDGTRCWLKSNGGGEVEIMSRSNRRGGFKTFLTPAPSSTPTSQPTEVPTAGPSILPSIAPTDFLYDLTLQGRRDCGGNVAKMFEGAGDNPGTNEERRNRCAEACFQADENNLGFIVWLAPPMEGSSGAHGHKNGRCFCEQNPSSGCAEPNPNSNNDYYRYDFVERTPAPSSTPTSQPTEVPTAGPSILPSTSAPSSTPTSQPTEVPTAGPSILPSIAPSNLPSTSAPSSTPTSQPTEVPTANPSILPSSAPSNLPSSVPTTSVPFWNPSASPSSSPTTGGLTSTPPQVIHGVMSLGDLGPVCYEISDACEDLVAFSLDGVWNEGRCPTSTQFACPDFDIVQMAMCSTQYTMVAYTESEDMCEFTDPSSSWDFYSSEEDEPTEAATMEPTDATAEPTIAAAPSGIPSSSPTTAAPSETPSSGAALPPPLPNVIHYVTTDTTGFSGPVCYEISDACDEMIFVNLHTSPAWRKGKCPKSIPNSCPVLNRQTTGMCPTPVTTVAYTETKKDCPMPDTVCCLAMSASCLACAADTSVEEYCAENPKTDGCDQEPSSNSMSSIIYLALAASGGLLVLFGLMYLWSTLNTVSDGGEVSAHDAENPAEGSKRTTSKGIETREMAPTRSEKRTIDKMDSVARLNMNIDRQSQKIHE